MKSNRSLGFTLIELLVVIAIIAILAAILFPVFAQAKAAAKKAADLSNIKQIGTATAIYQNDYDDLYELGTSYPNGPSYGYFARWSSQEVLGPYIKSVPMFLSPVDSTYKPDFSGGWSFETPLPTTRQPGPISYIANMLSTAMLTPQNSPPGTQCNWFPSTPTAVTDCTGPVNPGGWYVGPGSVTGVSATSATNPSDLIVYTNGSEQLADWWGCGDNHINTETFGCYGSDLVYGWDALMLAEGSYFGVPNADLAKAWRKMANQSNVAFSDTHAKTMQPGALMTGGSFLNPKYWLVTVPAGY